MGIPKYLCVMVQTLGGQVHPCGCTQDRLCLEHDLSCGPTVKLLSFTGFLLIFPALFPRLMQWVSVSFSIKMRQPNWLPLPLAQCGQGTFMPSVLRAHEMPKMLIQLEWAKVSPKVTQSWIDLPPQFWQHINYQYKIVLWLGKSCRDDGRGIEVTEFEISWPDSYQEPKWREGSEAWLIDSVLLS